MKFASPVVELRLFYLERECKISLLVKEIVHTHTENKVTHTGKGHKQETYMQTHTLNDPDVKEIRQLRFLEREVFPSFRVRVGYA